MSSDRSSERAGGAEQQSDPGAAPEPAMPANDSAAAASPSSPPRPPAPIRAPDAGDPPAPTAEESRAISRADFEAVIRRAAELSAVEAEEGAAESLSEEEVIRIAAELGLPSKHVRRALYELPVLESQNAGQETWFGPTMLSAARVVPGRADQLRQQIVDYLTTREYMQVVRQRQGRAFLMPADDTISQVARGLLRPSRRFHLSRARRVVLGVRPLEEGNAHIQITTDMSDQRKSAVRTGAFFGIAGGLVVGGLGAMFATMAGLPPVVETTAQVAAFATGLGGTITGALAASRAAFRAKVTAARIELDGLLDRAEHGDRLDPPPPPWRRRLRQTWLGG